MIDDALIEVFASVDALPLPAHVVQAVMRQNHAERDLAALGGEVAAAAPDWS